MVTMFTINVSPTFKGPIFKVPVFGLYAPFVSSLTQIRPLGNTSLTTTPVASFGPLFVMFKVQTTISS